jgi:phosphoenolpyruvate carboxylase
MLATLPADSIGAYVISMAQTASDVLCVKLLMREFGLTHFNMRVVRGPPSPFFLVTEGQL